NGLLVIASAYDWDEDKTPRKKWLGGFKKNGEKYSTFDALNDILLADFDLVGEPCEMTSCIQKTGRKQVCKSLHVSVWRKR
ncbi:MAG: SAM-dependent methyltransferase, partial [Sulfurospirillaceae bacterium]|nr:SAM-dependent methyltransferase [Sulfurospirillaceae bacterium]